MFEGAASIELDSAYPKSFFGGERNKAQISMNFWIKMRISYLVAANHAMIVLKSPSRESHWWQDRPLNEQDGQPNKAQTKAAAV